MFKVFYLNKYVVKHKSAKLFMMCAVGKLEAALNISHLILQGVPYHWAHFVFAIFSGSRAYTEELFVAIE